MSSEMIEDLRVVDRIWTRIRQPSLRQLLWFEADCAYLTSVVSPRCAPTVTCYTAPLWRHTSSSLMQAQKQSRGKWWPPPQEAPGPESAAVWTIVGQAGPRSFGVRKPDVCELFIIQSADCLTNSAIPLTELQAGPKRFMSQIHTRRIVSGSKFKIYS